VVHHVFDPILLSARNPGPMTGLGNNTWLLVSAEGSAALIDAGVGMAEHVRELDDLLRARQATLERVLVTHAHADHASGAPALARSNPNASFAKSPWPGEDEKYDVAWKPLRDGEQIVAGGVPLVVLHTPGHSPDHVTFWHEPTRTAFTGDLVILGGSVMIHTSRGGSLHPYLRSLDRLRALEPRRLLPAHGPEISDPVAVLTAYIDHRNMRERQVIEALRRGLNTVPGIAESIYHGLDAGLMPAARENVRAHLEALKAEGRATGENERWRLL
jgi:glyoxylase-like metal-dependent hydrolase (beta-lactamase superfamily II)